ncbi:MAG: BamA/TamA family outer membrane protein [Anditalea sp.]
MAILRGVKYINQTLFFWKKTLILGLVIFICGWHQVSAQTFLKYEVEGIKNGSGMKSFPDSLSREIFLKELIISFQLEGYPTAFVKGKTFYGDTLNVEVQAGEMYRWVVLKKGNLDDRVARQVGFQENGFQHRPFNFRQLKRLFDKILEETQNNGYPFASIRLDSIASRQNGISAALNFDYGPYITFDTVQITGNSKTSPIYLNRLLKMVPGTLFSQKKVDQSLRRLKNLSFVQVVSEPQLSFQNSEAIFYLPINDRRVNTLDGIIGILPNETEENKLLITGQFDLALYNVGGRGRNYKIDWQRLSQYSQNLNVTAEEPMLMGSSIDLKVSFYLLKEDTTFLNRDFKIDLGYRTSPTTYIGFFSRRQAGDLLAVSQWADAMELPDLADFRFNNYGINLRFNTLDDAFWPRRGWLSGFEFGIGNKRLVHNTGLSASLYQDIELTTLQYYLTLSIEKHFYFKPQVGGLIRMRAGEMANENLLVNDLYRLGGLKSIRGFNENFFFANRYVYVNFEPRYYFDDYSYMLWFTDIGGIQNKVGHGTIEWPFSFGGGLSLETNGGIFTFVYALGQSNTQLLGFDFSKIHFGYTGRF